MNKRFILTEEEKKEIRKNYFFEQNETSEDRKFCHKGNTKQLEEIMGEEEPEDYIEGIKLRKNGVHGLTDHLELLKTLRLHPQITDNGVHLAHTVMNNLKSYKPYNYFDEGNKECRRAMDKIIELYKENEHGEELVKDIEKVYASHHLDPRAKEFMKHAISMIKGD
jgi:hypothetical protein